MSAIPVSRPKDEESASFGFARVPVGAKQALVDDVFHKVAERYDLMNDLTASENTIATFPALLLKRRGRTRFDMLNLQLWSASST